MASPNFSYFTSRSSLSQIPGEVRDLPCVPVAVKAAETTIGYDMRVLFFPYKLHIISDSLTYNHLEERNQEEADLILILTSGKCDKDLPPRFLAESPCAVTPSYHVLCEKDVPFAKPPFLTAACFDLGPPVDGYHVLPADNGMPGILVARLDFPEEDRFCTSRLAEQTKRAFGLKFNPDIFKTGEIIRSVVEAGNLHGASL